MKTTKALTWAAVILFLGALAPAQDQPKSTTAEKQPELVPLKLEVVFSEYEESKKISSLPYTISVNANERRDTSLRMGLRVPIATGSFASGGKDTMNTQYQYQDVGTDIDCTAATIEGGRFSVNVRVNRSSLYNPGANEKAGNVPLSAQPIFSRFSSDLKLLMRDGETIQSTMATDPVSGRILKVDVTLHVVK
jgi:hypothetical protein